MGIRQPPSGGLMVRLMPRSCVGVCLGVQGGAEHGGCCQAAAAAPPHTPHPQVREHAPGVLEPKSGPPVGDAFPHFVFPSWNADDGQEIA